MDSFGFLEARELVGYGQTLHISADNFFKLAVLANCSEVTLDVIFIGPVHDPGFLGDHNADAAVLEGVAIDEALSDHW